MVSAPLSQMDPPKKMIFVHLPGESDGDVRDAGVRLHKKHYYDGDGR